MEKYLVGGAVRDRLLGLPVKDRDWVVVGHTVEQMLDAGYKPVGRDFPVFLHPHTHEEHALARTERKTGTGYHGFKVHASPDVTLQQDLQRRDLTINAIAETADGQLIDPFGGEQDIRNRVLRHVSPAFSEDPVRLLRVARFAARLADFKFSVAPETLALMQDLVAAGEVDTLVPERVWQELNAALATETPTLFFSTLRDAAALKVLLPEIDNLFGIAQPATSHPEIDTGLHTMLVLEQAARLSDKPATRFAALCHDVGKALTPVEHLPEHDGHEAAGVPLVEGLCDRLRVPNDYRDLALITRRYHGQTAQAALLSASALASLLTSMDSLRKPDRFEQFLLACEADCRGRTGFEVGNYRRFDYLRAAKEVFASVNAADIALAQSDKSTIKAKVFEARVAALDTFAAESGYSA